MNALLSSQESINQESPSILRSDWVDERQSEVKDQILQAFDAHADFEDVD